MFERLIRRVPPPIAPINVPTVHHWHEIESKIGLNFPSGYLEFCQIYGSGSFRGTIATDISFYNPCAERFQEEIQFEVQRYRDENDASGNEAIPYPIFPAINGVFPLAIDRNDNHVYWRTDSDDQKWAIVVQWGWTATNLREFTCSFPEFVERMFFRELNTVCWQEPWFLDGVQFVPMT
jgi:hypothetical protein